MSDVLNLINQKVSSWEYTQCIYFRVIHHKYYYRINMQVTSLIRTEYVPVYCFNKQTCSNLVYVSLLLLM